MTIAEVTTLANANTNYHLMLSHHIVRRELFLLAVILAALLQFEGLTEAAD